MTLKEILLIADTSHFDLLGMYISLVLKEAYTNRPPEADRDDMEDGFILEDTPIVRE